MLSQQQGPQGKHRRAKGGSKAGNGICVPVMGFAVSLSLCCGTSAGMRRGMLPVSVLWLGLESSWKLHGAVLH